MTLWMRKRIDVEDRDKSHVNDDGRMHFANAQRLWKGKSDAC